MDEKKLVKNWIIENIKNGNFKPNDKLLNESEFIKKFNISRTSLSSVVNNLKNKGIIYTIKGLGIYVSNQPFLGLITDNVFENSKSKIFLPTTMSPSKYFLKELENCNQKFSKEKWFSYVEIVKSSNSRIVSYSLFWIKKNLRDVYVDFVGTPKFFEEIENIYLKTKRTTCKLNIQEPNEIDKKFFVNIGDENSYIPVTRKIHYDSHSKIIGFCLKKDLLNDFSMEFSKMKI